MTTNLPATFVEADAIQTINGATFPAIVVFDDGAILWIGDGFHRLEAHKKIGRTEIAAEVRQGTARDAILHAVGSNASHGLRRTQADRRRAVERLLRDPEWMKWSDRRIGRVANVDGKTVKTIRDELAAEFCGSPTTKTKGAAEFRSANGKPVSQGSLVGDVLRTIPDDALITECRRRGLKVEAGDA